jgi:selenophosphate synthetase-related protein
MAIGIHVHQDVEGNLLVFVLIQKIMDRSIVSGPARRPDRIISKKEIAHPWLCLCRSCDEEAGEQTQLNNKPS